MDSTSTAQGRGFPVMLTAALMALTVNGAFGLVLAKASTNGQRQYDAWYHSGSDTQVAEATAPQHKPSARS